MNGLSFYLSSVKDHRRKQGQRISLPVFLTMVILGNMSGFTSLKSLARFFKNNEDYFSQKFGLMHGVPGYTRIRTLLEELDFESLNESFTNWSVQFVKAEGEWVSIDGKGLSSTATNYFDKYQNFHSMVSAFCREKEINITSTKFESKKKSEIAAAQRLIEQLELKNIILTLDALHCQKKRRNLSWSQEMTM